VAVPAAMCGSVRQCAIVLAVCGSMRQCVAMLRQCAVIDLRVPTLFHRSVDLRQRQCGSVQCVRQSCSVWYTAVCSSVQQCAAVCSSVR
jgi:hypothetical protein